MDTFYELTKDEIALLLALLRVSMRGIMAKSEDKVLERMHDLSYRLSIHDKLEDIKEEMV